MNKKVLVITLVLVMAFASSAMAAVEFGGEFKATAKQENFKVFQEGYDLEPSLGIDIKVSNENETDEVLNWEFSAETTLSADEFELGKYKLGLYDQHFTGYAWGNGQELSDKATYFDMIKAGKKAGEDEMRARLEIPVMDLADVTLDFEAKDNIRVFVEGNVEGFDVGLAYARTDWTDEDEIANVIVGQVGTEVPAGDVNVDLKAAAGIALGEDLGFALGLGAESDITDELNVGASVTHASEHWNGDNVTADNTVVAADATYTETDFQVKGSVKHTFVKDADGENEIKLGAKYRMSDKVAYDKLFNDDPSDGDTYYNLDAPAFGVSTKFVDFKFDNVTADAAAPIINDMIWARAYASFEDKDTYGAGVMGYIQATSKLVVKPSVDYKSEGTTVDVKGVAVYKIGLSDTTLSFTAQKVFSETSPESLLEATVKVPF